MDFSSFLNYAQTLAMLYVWTLFAAGVFAIGEMIVQRARGTRGLSLPDAGERSAS